MKIDTASCLMKFSILLLVLALFPLPYSLILAIFLTWVYQYVIAIIYGVHAMPTMDSMCFLGADTSRTNFISFTIIDKNEFSKIKSRINSFMKDKPKLRYKVVRIWGDYYWKDTKIEDSINDVFTPIPKECHSEKDIE
jgi:hypothetical protein